MQCLGDSRSGRYYCRPVGDDGALDRSSTAPDTSSPYKSAMVQLLCSLYGLTLIVLAIVFSVSSSLQRHGDVHDTIYLQALKVYLFVMALLFLGYVHAYVLRRQHRRVTVADQSGEPTLEKNARTCLEMDEGLTDELQDTDAECKDKRSETPVIHAEQPTIKKDSLPSGVTFDAQDVNFYLRLGAIAFGIGTMVQDGFQLSQLLQDGKLVFRCIQPFNILVIILHIIFTFVQTYYIFKSHKIVVHQQKCIVRFGFIHLVATNIAVWICTAVFEIQTDYRVKHYSAEGASSSGGKGNGLAAGDITTVSSTVMSSTASPTCNPAATLSRQASPYLYPCTVQYSLIVAAILCQMYRNIGLSLSSIRHAPQSSDQEAVTSRDETSTSVDCDKAHRGLFLGLFILVLTLVAVSCYFVVGENAFNAAGTADHQLYACFIFYTTQLVLLTVSSAAVVIAGAKFRQMRFVPPTDVDVGEGIFLETSLLISALGAVALLECFRAVSAVSTFAGLPGDVGDDASGSRTVVAILSAATSAAVFVQVALQTVFVIDAMRRVVRTPGQHRRKPGRTLVTFLLLSNLSLFVVTVFDVDRPENVLIHTSVYGPVAWSIITRVAFPLTIFYRFHSVVCLSDIWNNAYKVKDK